MRDHRCTALAALKQLLRIAFAAVYETAPGAVAAMCRFDGPFRGWTAARFLRWVDNQPPEFHRELTMALYRQPDTVVRVVKELRALAKDRRFPTATRRQAARTLKESGFDDESLRNEDVGARA